ncbi:LOW QUALITY PROTEIN: tRNA methyltransferase 10 homolog A-like [Haliotis rubra]|uniref:LOW QUALITY PROTEIN: tRNA methyltransferase 10 homolog A-like n=1 Tax=Haliotis rubra TaxID=36100 RepID=UPI001EE630E2|nr:LOW QUALITY PROTEIN: tRNA methyltransferase 10 homolog A-like [Haliotis rubra]
MSETDKREVGSVVKDNVECSTSEDERESPGCSDEDEKMKGLSKRARKRLLKHKRWEETKSLKRKQDKLKKKRKFEDARERGQDLGPSRKSLKKNCMQNSRCKVKAVIDCSFDEHMTEKDVRHLVQQIQHSYSANRRADNPLQFYVCGINGKALQRLDQIGDYKGWDVYFKTENYLDLFPKGDVVYLSSDSPNVLQELEDDKVYIIGGLVDHNHHKGLCHQLAVDREVSHAQLPITEYVEMKTRKVLTINHVFEILLRYTETKDWKKAFFQVLPQRKGLKEKEKEDSQDVPKKDLCVKAETVNNEGSSDATNKQINTNTS